MDLDSLNILKISEGRKCAFSDAGISFPRPKGGLARLKTGGSFQSRGVLRGPLAGSVHAFLHPYKQLGKNKKREDKEMRGHLGGDREVKDKKNKKR